MSFEWLIAKRYLWSKRRHPFVGVVSSISVIGIAVGVAALIVVLAVMNGFDEDLKERIIGLRAHLTVEKDGEFREAAAVTQSLEKTGVIAGVSSYVEGQALFQVGEWGTGVLVRGIDTRREKTVSRFYQCAKQGTLSDKADGVVVGTELAHRAGIKIGSRVLMATQAMEKPAPLVVEGIFNSGMYEYDANLVFVNLPNAQKLFGLKDAVSGLSIYLKNADQAEAVKKNIHSLLGYPFEVRTWMDANRTLFSALKLEKMVMFLILVLIILVASLNIAGSLTILVMDKTKDVGVLRALGASPMSLVKVFALDGLVLGFLGAGSGFGVGMGICWLLKKYSFIELPREVYYIDRLPVKMNPSDTVWVMAVAVGLSFVSAFYPALMAGRLDPVKALRYE